MTDPKEVIAMVMTGGRFVLDTYFAAVDAKQQREGATPQPLADTGHPSILDFLAAAGAKFPGVNEAVADMTRTSSPLVTPPPTSRLEEADLALIEKRLQEADREINARMSALQERVKAIQLLLRDLCVKLGAPDPAPAAPGPAPPPLAAVLEVLTARESMHHGRLAEGEEAVAELEQAAAELSARIDAASGGPS
jgi:hypothetical protein